MCACAYFWTYRKPHDLPEFAPAVSAASYIQYIFAFLGSGLARWMAPHHLGLSAIVGVVIICLFSGAVIYTARRWRDREFLVRTLPWLTLGIYSLANAVLASLGRIAFGVDQALASRYVTYSLYLTVAVIALVSVIAQERLQPPTSVRTRRVVFVTCLILALLYLTLSWFSCGQSVSTMRLACVRSRLARGAVVFSQSLDTAAVIKEYSYPRPQFVQIQAAALDNLRLLRPGLIRNNDISALRYDDVDNRNASGWCDGIMPVGNQFYRATGWTVLNRKHFPADCVVLAYKIPARDWTAFAISDGMFEREDIVRLCGGDRDLLWSGWSATFPRDLVPTGATVSAWALDAADSKLYRLKQKFEGLPF
jgi:hypothetical protein